MSYIKKINRFFILGILILCVFSINSCSKKKDTLAVIEVLDSVTESPIINSSVRLFYVDASGSSKFDLSKNTNSNGFVTLSPYRSEFFAKEKYIIPSKTKTKPIPKKISFNIILQYQCLQKIFHKLDQEQ